MRLLKMMAQEVSEAATRMPITICTTRLACTIRFTIDKSPPIIHFLTATTLTAAESPLAGRSVRARCGNQLGNRLRQTLGAQAAGVEARDPQLCAGHRLVLLSLTPDALCKAEACATNS